MRVPIRGRPYGDSALAQGVLQVLMKVMLERRGLFF